MVLQAEGGQDRKRAVIRGHSTHDDGSSKIYLRFWFSTANPAAGWTARASYFYYSTWMLPPLM